MEIIEVSSNEYSEIIKSSFHIFGTVEFNNYNKLKCENIHYLLFKDAKVRMGIIGGVNNNIFSSPFSAPFGGFTFVNEDIKINNIDESIKLLIHWAQNKGYASLNITLPPINYSESFLSKCFNCFNRSDFILNKVDLNYSFNLKDFSENYIDNIWHNARKNLNRSFKSNFEFIQCSTESEKLLAYEIIKNNRELRGFPLRMSYSQLIGTTSIIKADFFIVKNEVGVSVASAIVFHVSTKIVQVVYWGDLPEYNNLKTMNYLSFKVFEFYKFNKIEIVDIGPSSENSIPNLGLCEFKESIGCRITPKLSFTHIL